MTASTVEIAALNNALWCDTVCAAHGVPGDVLPTVWLNRNLPPPYHSNLVVISSMATQAEIDGHVRDLSLRALSPTWSLKDSFMSLAMAPPGFGVLFEAQWIWLDADRVAEVATATAARCVRITSTSDLALWEASWRQDTGNKQAAAGPRQFPEALLRDPKVAFLACMESDQIVAVGIANRTPGVIGLSNVVVNAQDRRAAWMNLVALAGRLFPGFPIVGYERDDDLRAAEASGFRTIGPLRVWIRTP